VTKPAVRWDSMGFDKNQPK